MNGKGSTMGEEAFMDVFNHLSFNIYPLGPTSSTGKLAHITFPTSMLTFPPAGIDPSLVLHQPAPWASATSKRWLRASLTPPFQRTTPQPTRHSTTTRSLSPSDKAYTSMPRTKLS